MKTLKQLFYKYSNKESQTLLKQMDRSKSRQKAEARKKNQEEILQQNVVTKIIKSHNIWAWKQKVNLTKDRNYPIQTIKRQKHWFKKWAEPQGPVEQ